MAERPDVNLGSVGFGLFANTEDLERSLSLLTQFGERVNRAVASINDATAAWARQQVQVERTLSGQFDKVAAVSDRLKKLGAMGEEELNKLNAGYQRIVQTLTKGDLLPVQELNRAFTGTNILISQGARAAKEMEDQMRQARIQQEGLHNAQQRTATLLQQLSQRRAGTDVLDQARANLRAYEVELSRGTLSAEALQAANQKLVSSQAGLARQWRDQATAARAASDAQTGLANQALKQQQLVFDAQQRTLALTSSMTIKGAPTPFIDQANAALKQYEASLKSSTLTTAQLQSANQRFEGSLNSISRAYREQAAAANMSASATLSYQRQATAVERLNIRAGRVGVDNQLIIQNQQNLQKFGDALKGLGAQDKLSALNALQAGMFKTKDAIADATKSGTAMSNFMYDLNKATILAMGPLSGFGARVSAIASLFESTTTKMVLFIGSAVAAGAAFAAMGFNAVKASMDMEKFNALLTSATGSAALSGEEFEYLLGQANRLGQRVQGLVAPYASFATAARLSGFTLREQRDVFESVLVTGAALRFDTNKTERAFLALEQMISKGTVQMQELKLQLGQVIPGAMEIAAIAMKKTTAELMKMMESGQLTAKEFVTNLAPTLKAMFGAGALEGSRTLQAELERLHTATFVFNKTLDEQLRISNAVRIVVVALADSINYLSMNMQSIIPIAAGVAAAIAAIGAVMASSFLVGLLPSLTAITVGFQRLAAAAAFVGWSGALLGVRGLTFALGGLPGLLIKIVAGLGAGVLAYKAFSQQAVEGTGKTEEFIRKTDEWLNHVNEVGFAHKRTYEQMKARTDLMIRQLTEQAEATYMLLYAELEREKAAGRDPGKTVIDPETMMEIPYTKTKTVLQIEAQQAAIQKGLAGLQAQRARIDAITNIKEFQISGVLPKDNKAFDNWINRIQDLVTEYTKVKTIALDPTNVALEQQQEALAKVDKLWADMPKKAGDLARVQKMLTDAGFPGDKPKEQLLAMITSMEALKDQTAMAIKQEHERAQGLEKSRQLYQDIRDRIEAAQNVIAGGAPEELNRARERNRLMTDFVEALTKGRLMSITLSAELLNVSAQIDKMQDADRLVADMKRIREGLDKISGEGFNKVDRAWTEWAKKMSLIEEATRKLMITEVERTQYVAMANRQLYNDLWAAADDWVKKARDMIVSLETDVANALADVTIGRETSFKDFLKNMERDILAFGYRIMLLKPLLTGLFGDLYTGGGAGVPGATGSFGWIGNALSGMGLDINRLLGFTPGNTSLINDIKIIPNFADLAASGIMHGGGIVGATPTTNVPASWFAGAPRAHMGLRLGASEVPIIAKRGERVLNEQQTQEWEENMRPLQVHFHITTPDVDGFRASYGQISADMHTVLGQYGRRNN